MMKKQNLSQIGLIAHMLMIIYLYVIKKNNCIIGQLISESQSNIMKIPKNSDYIMSGI